ncbi:WD repeat-containing protein 5B [Gracilariopsis chorda]|uniref:WD repeat-containing protein 5B n=1 Tax=Gracilariopsis chorda TaxID=448386 RepID=A0A2V3IL28_9FLOR|nr:WD repeat-containing protein 5B [Gracilariopsis chorda]|eukprot:PXF42795.1 WD repeat-containing protein 5B [Gracilariopsis chorda]
MERNLSSNATPPLETGRGEAFYKKQLEISTREKAQLQERIHELENRNTVLIKSLFELSILPPGSTATNRLPFDVVQALRKLPTTSAEHLSSFSGKGSAYRRSGNTERSLLGLQSSTGIISSANPNYTPFRKRAELIGHNAAIYAIQFSGNGQRLASVSFDKSICVWSVDRFLDSSTYEPCVSISDAHRAPIVAVEWTFDSARIMTGSLDHTVAEWDVDSGGQNAVTRYSCSGLVNAVSVSPANDNLVFFATSKNAVHLIDRRAPTRPVTDPLTLVANESVVNTIHVTLDGNRFITGDHGGAIKSWDLRMVESKDQGGVEKRDAALLDTAFNDENHHPITHVHTCPPTAGEDFGRLMAVNSYDAFLRVYDRGQSLFKGEKPVLRPLHALRSVHNRHWPIKSSFFMGDDYHPSRLARKPMRKKRNRSVSERSSERSPSTDMVRDGGDQNASWDEEDDCYSISSSNEDDEEHQDTELMANTPETTSIGDAIESSLVLASGSADGNVYVFDVGGSAGTGTLVQTLIGHKDIAYSVDFHPCEPILASCSADSKINIWHSAL